jgi:hypothetical protein
MDEASDVDVAEASAEAVAEVSMVAEGSEKTIAEAVGTGTVILAGMVMFCGSGRPVGRTMTDVATETAAVGAAALELATPGTQSLLAGSMTHPAEHLVYVSELRTLLQFGSVASHGNVLKV